MVLGKSQREKDSVRVASVALFNREGRLLFGKRKDSGSYCLPGGHLNPDESPLKGALRELLEEANLKPDSSSVEFLGSAEIPGKDLTVYSFRAKYIGTKKPSAKNDPDDECGEFLWVDEGDLPEPLHNKQDATLQLLGLQDKSLDLQTDSSEDLDKVVLDPNAGYRFVYRAGDTTVYNGEGKKITLPMHHVDAYFGSNPQLDVPSDLNPQSISNGRKKASNQQVGSCYFEQKPDHTLHPHWVHVNEEHRRKGLASAMYSHAEKLSGMKIQPSAAQTDAGQALWEGNRKEQQFGDPTNPRQIHLGFGKAEEPLEKGFIGTLGALATGAALSGQPHMPAAVQQPAEHVQQASQWTPKGLHPELHPIAHLESSFGQNIQHAKHHNGSFQTAYGAVGLKPQTAHEEYKRQVAVKAKYPGLDDPTQFEAKFKADPEFYNTMASAHWSRLRALAGSPARTAYAWRYGLTAQKNASNEQVANSDYVKRFQEMLSQVKKTEGEPLDKMALKDIKPGKPMPSIGEDQTKYADYSHALSPIHRKNGYSIKVAQWSVRPKGMTPYHNLSAYLYHKGEQAGAIEGMVDPRHVASVGCAEVHRPHRGKGLGTHLYEAFYRHAMQLGATHTEGGEHSSSAHAVHQKLAEKHGLGYEPDRSNTEVDENGKRYDQSGLELPPEGAPFDGAYEGYHYALKSEIPDVAPHLTDDLRHAKYRGAKNPLTGHCYVATEALYHHLGGASSGFVPQFIQHEGGPHWYLKHKETGQVVDPTASQFKSPVPYASGKGKGFLTRDPSKRAQVVIKRLRAASMQKVETTSQVLQKPIPVKHYSVQKDLTVADPKFQGTGLASLERNRPSRVPRTYYYTREGSPERMIEGGGTHLYHGELPAGTRLYDMGKDPLKLLLPKWKNTKAGQFYVPADFDAAERTLVKKGFHGYHNYGTPNAIAYFHSLPVRKVPGSNMAKSEKLSIDDVHDGLVGELDGLKVWRVHGDVVRNQRCVDFTTGGNSEAYDFVPKDELWVDGSTDQDRAAVALHEYVESTIMAGGVSHDEAHDRASKVEGAFRKTEQSTLEQVKVWIDSQKDLAKTEIDAAKALRNESDNIRLWVASKTPRKLLKSGAEGNDEEEGLEGANSIAADMCGFSPKVLAAFEAARFLTGGEELSIESIRAALYEHDDDYETAALHAYGIPEDDSGFNALRACMNIGSMHKAEESPPPTATDIKAGVLEARDTADEIERAFKRGEVKNIHLGGKHSSGTLIARDPQTGNVWLLKPGAHGPGPAKGAQEEHASQSRREACFWHVAEAWGLENSLPHCDLVIIDGAEWAAMRLLPFNYQNLDKKAQKDHNLPARVLESYRHKGILHKWAILDYILGNPDRHGQNLMVNKDNTSLALIDHGSAFAGEDFDPGFDKNSFVPFYLRAWGPRKFNSLTLKEKLDRMPQVSEPVRYQLGDWLDDIHADRLQGILSRYGIDPRPTLVRLAKVKMFVSQIPPDQAINKLWVTT